MQRHTIIYVKARAALGWAAWAVCTPAKLSPSGKKRRDYYHTEREARAAAAALEAAITETGRAGAKVATAPNLDQLRMALSILDNTGISLTEAAQFADAGARIYGSLDTAHSVLTWARDKYGADRWPNLTLEQAYRRMIDVKSATLRPATSSHYRYALNALMRANTLYFSNTRPCDVTPAELENACSRASHTNNTFNRLVHIMSVFFSWCIRRSICGTNPALQIDKRAHRQREIQAISVPDLIALLTACRPPTTSELAAASDPSADMPTKANARDTSDMLLYFAIGAFAGIRPTELRRLTLADINLEDNVISVRNQTSKTGGTRHVRIRPNLRAWILHCVPAAACGTSTKPIAPKWPAQPQAVCIRRAGITWQHDVLRHSFASYSIKSGEAIEDVRRDMGHSDTDLLRSTYTNMRGLTANSASQYWAIVPDSIKS